MIITIMIIKSCKRHGAIQTEVQSLSRINLFCGGGSVTSAMQEREWAGLQALKGQTQRQVDVGEGKGPHLMNFIMEGVSFYIPSAFHRMIRT